MTMGQSHPWILNKVKKIKQEWSLPEPMVELFEKIEEGVDLYESTNTPTSWRRVVNISYLLIHITGGTEKYCDKWEDMQVRQYN